MNDDVILDDDAMMWSVANLLIQIITGIFGAHAAAVVAREHSFGMLGHTIAGAVGGGLSGVFLQTLAATVVTGTGSLNELSPVEQWIIQGLTGAVAGSIAMLMVGLVRHAIDEHKSAKH